MLASKRRDTVCRPILEEDLDAVIACLQRGFPERPRCYWVRALERMARRPPIEDYPRYGHALFANGLIVGVLLQIFSRRDAPNGSRIVCNLSSWCVDLDHRGHSAMLHLSSVKRKEVTYVNISPAIYTRPAIEAFGFRRFSEGQMVAAPLLSAPRRGARIVAFDEGRAEAALLSDNERQILADHAAMGCRAILCLEDGVAYPFVFQPGALVRGLIPCPHLIYCRRVSEFVRFAHPIGRHLMFRSGPFCLVDATAHVPGLVGRYFPERIPKYYKGPAPPGLGDLAYTELIILGP